MDITVKDLELLVNDRNKTGYNSMYNIILDQFEDSLRYIDVGNLSEERQKVIGTCGIYLSSIVELLHTLRDLIDKGHIESAGSVATACWERTLTLRKIMIEPIVNAQIHTDHVKVKKTPWTIYNMVCDVLAKERRNNNITIKSPFEEKNFYMQYTVLSSIKHGNPFTISYIYRPGFSSDEKLFRLKSNDSIEDKDLKIYIKMLVIDNALDALLDYSREFRTNYSFLEDMRQQFDNLIGSVELQVPSIMLTTPEELGQDYWNYLLELEKRRKF